MNIKEFKKSKIVNSEAIVGGFYDTCTADNCVNHNDYTTSTPAGTSSTDSVGGASDEDC
jgi:hypothetical protein